MSLAEAVRALESMLSGVEGVVAVAGDRQGRAIVVLVTDSRVCRAVREAYARLRPGYSLRCIQVGRVAAQGHSSHSHWARTLRDQLTGLLGIRGFAGVHVSENPHVTIMVEDEETAELAPRRVNGLDVRVVVVGRVEALAARGRVRPLVGGASLGVPELNTSGTLGVVLGRGVGVTNAHVIALGPGLAWRRRGAPVIQPGRLDGGGPGDVVGSLQGYEVIDFNRPEPVNTVDLAWFKASVAYEPGEIMGVGRVRPVALEAEPGLRVESYGRTSGHTTGRVEYVGANIKVWYTPGDYAVFRDQVITTAMSRPGDSGSVLVADGMIAGLVFAGSNLITVASPAVEVLSRLPGGESGVAGEGASRALRVAPLAAGVALAVALGGVASG